MGITITKLTIPFQVKQMDNQGFGAVSLNNLLNGKTSLRIVEAFYSTIEFPFREKDREESMQLISFIADDGCIYRFFYRKRGGSFEVIDEFSKTLGQFGFHTEEQVKVLHELYNVFSDAMNPQEMPEDCDEVELEFCSLLVPGEFYNYDWGN